MPAEAGADLTAIKLIMGLERVNGAHVHGSTVFRPRRSLVRVGFREGEIATQCHGLIHVHVAKTGQNIEGKTTNPPHRPPKIRLYTPQTKVRCSRSD